LGASNLTLSGSSSTITGPAFGVTANNYIVTNSTGNLIIQNLGVGGRTGNVLFPVGSSTSLYNPLTLLNSGTMDNYSVRVSNGAPSNVDDATKMVQAVWNIAETLDGGSDLTVQTQWVTPGDEGSSFNRNLNLKIARYLGTGTDWEFNNATLSGSNPYNASASGFQTIGTTGATFVTGNFVLITPDVSLSSPSQVSAQNMPQASLNNVIYNFQLAVSTASATLNSVTFTTVASPAYTAADISNFKLWYNSTNSFSGAKLLKSITGAGAGANTFNAFTRSIASATTGYFFITADIQNAATVGNGLYINAITTTDLGFVVANKSG